jgi:hypothetical protein
VTVDEQETEPIASVGGREAPQQEGTIPADDQREVPVVRISVTVSRTRATISPSPCGSMMWVSASRSGDALGSATSP